MSINTVLLKAASINLYSYHRTFKLVNTIKIYQNKSTKIINLFLRYSLIITTLQLIYLPIML